MQRTMCVSISNGANLQDNKELIKNKKFNFGRCKVCKDKATGIHYGIPSCEGCKGFYKRSVDKYHNYVCYFGSKCKVTPGQRRRCKLCRWKLCVAAGMSFDCIQMGRISRARKEKVKKILDLDTPTEVNYNNYNNPKSSRENHEKRVITIVHPIQMRLTEELREKCYLAYVEFSKDMDEIYQHAIDCLKYNKPKPLAADRIDQTTVQIIWKKCMKKMSENIQHIVQYIKSLPGFSQLDVADLVTLFEEHTGALFGLQVTKSYIQGEVFFMIKHNIRLTRSLSARLMGCTLQERIYNFHEKFNNLRLNHQEMSLLMPTIMTFIPEGMVLNYPNQVKELHKQYNRALIREFILNNRSDEFIQELIEIMRSAPNRKNIANDLRKGI